MYVCVFLWPNYTDFCLVLFFLSVSRWFHWRCELESVSFNSCWSHVVLDFCFWNKFVYKVGCDDYFPRWSTLKLLSAVLILWEIQARIIWSIYVIIFYSIKAKLDFVLYGLHWAVWFFGTVFDQNCLLSISWMSSLKKDGIRTFILNNRVQWDHKTVATVSHVKWTSIVSNVNMAM